VLPLPLQADANSASAAIVCRRIRPCRVIELAPFGFRQLPTNDVKTRETPVPGTGRPATESDGNWIALRL
jgi:hypothetical protein